MNFIPETSENKNRQKELPEEYLEKRAQAKKQQQELLHEKIAKSELEKSRLAKAWAGDRQMGVPHEEGIEKSVFGGINVKKNYRDKTSSFKWMLYV